MQSSNSGSQRLSQAALSRSHFLRLAAGALFPFVRWHLPAAAAPNPELAQNSGGPGTKQAAGPGRTGAILVSQFGPVKIHSYLSPADGLQVNTQMIEGPNAVVIFDTIIIGHDTPVDRFAIDTTMTYVKRAKEIHAASADAKTYSENLKAAFPNLQLARFVDLSASYLYAAPH
jgi:hypothetical protein